MSPENDDFHIDLTFTGRDNTLARPIAAVVAVAGIIFIIATMTTNVAAHLLPMSDDYLQAMIPLSPDGTEGLGLTDLKHDITDNTISVNGSIQNLSEKPVSNIVAVIDMTDTTGRFPQSAEVPVMPTDLAPGATGTFMTMATLQQKPAGYILKFKFADGPFIPHKDQRGPAITITPQPKTQ